MRRRLSIGYVTLTAALLLGTEVPLGAALAAHAYRHAADRQVTATLLLSSAVEAGGGADADDADGSVWRAEARSLGLSLDTVAVLFDEQGRVVRAIGADPDAVTPGVWHGALGTALNGQRAVEPSSGTAAGRPRSVVAEPVVQQGRVVGAVATVASVAPQRSAVFHYFLLLFCVGLAVMVAVSALAIRLERWGFAPARQLELTVRQIAQGEYTARARIPRGPAEFRELAEALNAAVDRLMSLLEAQRVFVADAAHQLRNALTALRVRIESLEAVADRGDELPEELTEALADALSEAERLGRVLDELLALAKVSASDSGFEAVEVRSVVESRARTWSSYAEKADVTIAVQGCRSVALCRAGTLDQVLDVLLDNAIGFAPLGGRITVRVRSDDSTVSVEVEDQGPGIPGRDKERAADRFWRGRQPRGRSGSGLGLAIAKTLLQASDGRLELEDAQPHGLLARAVLPRAASPSAALRTAPPLPAAPPPLAVHPAASAPGAVPAAPRSAASQPSATPAPAAPRAVPPPVTRTHRTATRPPHDEAARRRT